VTRSAVATRHGRFRANSSHSVLEDKAVVVLKGTRRSIVYGAFSSRANQHGFASPGCPILFSLVGSGAGYLGGYHGHKDDKRNASIEGLSS